MTSTDRKTDAVLMAGLTTARRMLHNRKFLHLKSGQIYHVTDISYREHDMVLTATYTPIGPFYGLLTFNRPISEFIPARYQVIEDM
jgi:hypothetical protein